MKKLITLSLLLVCFALTGQAQGTASYFTLCDDALSGSSGMTVKAILDLSNSNIYWGNSYGRYQVAAFIEGECHAIAMEGDAENMTYWDDRDLYANWFVLNIRYTSTRRSKPITFKMYNKDTGLEYTLKNDDNIRSIGINMGADDKPIVLKAIEAKSMSFTDFEMKVNDMQDLSSKLSFSPADATCPNNLEFEIYPDTYTLDVTGNGGYQFTPSATGSYDISQYQYGLAFRNGTITVTRATNYVSGLSINPGYETITVTKGDADMLGDILAKALNVSYYYNYEPDEYPEWVSSDESIVGPDASGRLTPKKKGTCTLTAQVYHPTTGAVRLSASLTVKVGTFVTYISVLHDNLNCTIGDDVTDYLPRMIDVQPSDADDRSVNYSIIRGEGILEKRADGHIVAVGEGMVMIEVTANDGAGASPATLYVNVQNIKKTISVKQKTLTIKYEGNGRAQDISAAINGNVAFLPEDALFAGGEPTFTSGNTGVVTIEQTFSATGGAELKATALKAGTAEITVRMEVPDLIGQSLAETGTYVEPLVVTETFTVVLTQDLSSISFSARDYSMNVGETKDFTDELSGYPSDAPFDKSKVTLWVPADYKDYVKIDGLKVTALLPTAPKDFTLTATVPDASPSGSGTDITAETDLRIYSPATAINVNSGYETIEVYVGETTKLTEAMGKAFSLVPANSTSSYYYEVADKTVVDYDEANATFTPLKGGTTKITAIVSGNTSLKAELTVKVLVRAGGISFAARDYPMNVGETKDFRTELSVYPEDAVFDWSKVVLSVPNDYKDHVKIDGLKVTALQPTAPKDFTLTATVPDASPSGSGTDITAETDLRIYSPATAINVNSGYETIEVYVGETTKLTDAMGKAFSLVPANSTSSYYYEVADKTVVDYDEANATFTPLKGGTTKITAIVSGNTSLKAELTVKVLVRAGGISFAARDYPMNVGETKDFRTELSVYPADAVFDWSKVVLSVPNDYKDHVKIDGLKVTALQPTAPKDFTLTATVPDASPSGSGTDITAETDLRIYSPATAINVNSGYENITVNEGQNERLSTLLNQAITLLPANTTDGYSWHFDDESIASENPDGPGFVARKAGTTKATAYVGSWATATLKADLTITVLPLADGLSLPEEVVVNMGETLDLKTVLSITPADAAFDYTKVKWTMKSSDADSYFTISNNILTPIQPYKGYFTIEAAVEGTAMTAQTRVYILQPATALTVKSGMETIEVFVGQYPELTERVNETFVVTPNNTTDVLVYTSADESIVSIERDEVLTPEKVGTTRVIATLYDFRDRNSRKQPRFQKSVNVVVKSQLQGISFAARDYPMNVGETKDFRMELSVYPADAEFDWSKVVLSVPNDYKDHVKIDGLKVTALQPTAPKDFTLTATVPDASPSGSGTDITAETDLRIYSPATAINVNSGYETIEVYVGETTKLTEAMGKAFSLVPANSTSSYYYEVADKTVVDYDEANATFTPLKGGTTKITAIVSGNTSLQAELTVRVLEKVEDLEIAIDAPDVWRVGVPATLTVKATNGSTLVASAVSVTDKHESPWPLVSVDNIKSNDNGTVAVTLTPLAPGTDRVNVAYSKHEAQKDITIGVPTTLKAGWQWMTLYSDSEKDPAKVFSNNIHEVRSQTDLLAYEEGEYYGTLTLEANKAYMVRAASDVTADKAFLQTNGLLITQDTPFSLYDGWTWLAYPYTHAYAPADLQLQPAEGDRIVSKSSGFAEYADGAWTGSLVRLTPYEAYLYYNNKGAAASLVWLPETTVYEAAQGGKARTSYLALRTSYLTPHPSPFAYDPSPYRTNMTMIAVLPSSIILPPSSLIGAFVGEECRGEGCMVDGKFFITVHANDGEKVSFRLYNGITGIASNINETVTVTRMLGTVRHPLQLTCNDTQGIEEIESGRWKMEGEIYDLQGHRVANSQRPAANSKRQKLIIQRASDGRYKKVVVR